LKLKTEQEISLEIAGRIRAIRVSHGLTQPQLSERSGISLGSYRRFEQTGRIEFVSLIRIAQVLQIDGDFESLFSRPPVQSLDELERLASAAPKKPRASKQK
jgi:transcriptional regulator with XRE-family HTH domain